MRFDRHRLGWIIGLTVFSPHYAKSQVVTLPSPSAQPSTTISIADQSQSQVTVSINRSKEIRSANFPYRLRPLFIPTPLAGREGLEALLVLPPGSSAHPLAIITHGTPRNPEQRAVMNPLSMLPMAIEFARRGWTTVILMRRGYGRSGGKFAEGIGDCDHPDYIHSSSEAARDIRTAINYLSTLAEVDSRQILLIGRSTGGLAVVAAMADPPPGVVAGVNFAGGTGSNADNEVCHPDALVDAFGSYGTKARIPMLWVYAENDHYSSSELAEHFYKAFTQGGGQAEFVRSPPFQEDGHNLFSFEGIPIWTRYIDSFLLRQKLVLRSNLLPPPPLPNVLPPAELRPQNEGAFKYYLSAPPNKAFAVSSDGSFGSRFGELTAEDAENGAIHNCDQRTPKHDCRIAFVNNQALE